LPARENCDMDDELIKRAEDLAERCCRTASVTCTGFLTPAECFRLEHWKPRSADCTVILHGGFAGAERKVAFFLPDWMEVEYFDPEEHICALQLTARFGNPGHRDYLGAALGLGIGREWLGDILVDGERAWMLCLPSVQQHLLLNLDKVGRWGVRAEAVPLANVPKQERKLREDTFSVKSLRLDAVCAGMFRLSRTAAAELIGQGMVTLNYSVCIKPDAAVKEGDVLSLRGKGKGTVLDAGSRSSQKGRLFVKTGLYQ